MRRGFLRKLAISSSRPRADQARSRSCGLYGIGTFRRRASGNATRLQHAHSRGTQQQIQQGAVVVLQLHFHQALAERVGHGSLDPLALDTHGAGRCRPLLGTSSSNRSVQWPFKNPFRVAEQSSDSVSLRVVLLVIGSSPETESGSHEASANSSNPDRVSPRPPRATQRASRASDFAE